jgi:transcription elongation GreA/GreB family factor
MNKSQLLDKIISVLETAYQNAVEAADQAHATATDGENIAENKYDTLGLEAAYLAHGQSQRAADLKVEIADFKILSRNDCSTDDEISVGTAVVMLDETGREQTLFIGPGAGGLKLAHQGKDYLVITPAAPLGKALLGCYSHDEINSGPGTNAKTFEIIKIF